MAQLNQHPKLTRRHFLRWIAGLGISAGAMASYVRVVEPNWLRVEQVEIPIKGLPTALDGKRIGQLSDLHLSQFLSSNHLQSAIDQISRLAPDWLVLTGDYVGDRAEDAAGLVDPLRSLSMPRFAVYGNHDCWSDKPTVTRYLHEANVTVMLNTATEVESGLWIGGVDDIWDGHPDIKATLHDVPTDQTTILLAHEPDYFNVVLRENAPVALQLSGHSHGGQVRLPTLKPDPAGNYSYAPILPQHGRDYPIGLRFLQGHHIYTNRGLGVWPMPYRFNCPPELTIFTLRSL